MKQETPDILRLRSRIFPGEKQSRGSSSGCCVGFQKVFRPLGIHLMRQGHDLRYVSRVFEDDHVMGIETEHDELKITAAENKQAFLHPDRIGEISQYILNNFRQKTHRKQAGGKGVLKPAL
jgi:hypothetical protein